MKILVIGLDGFLNEAMLADEQLPNLYRLIEFGSYAHLTIPEAEAGSPWNALFTGRLSEHADDHMQSAIWEHLTEAGKRPFVIGPSLNDARALLVYPPPDSERIALLDYPLTSDQPASRGIEYLGTLVTDMSRQQLSMARQMLQLQEWDYFQFVVTGLSAMQRLADESAYNAAENPIRDYLRNLDDELGKTFELLDENTVVVLISMGPWDASSQDRTRQSGFFLLAAASNPLPHRIEGMNLIDVAPTLLEMAGRGVPDSLEGKSLFASGSPHLGVQTDLSPEEEELLRERLSGLGYIG